MGLLSQSCSHPGPLDSAGPRIADHNSKKWPKLHIPKVFRNRPPSQPPNRPLPYKAHTYARNSFKGATCMATRKQRAANRRNAQLSTGPPVKTNSTEQTQSAPEIEPNPLPHNGLTPAAAQNGNAEIAPAIDGRRDGRDKSPRRGPGCQTIRRWAPLVASAPAR